jgi:thioredoxin 1
MGSNRAKSSDKARVPRVFQHTQVLRKPWRDAIGRHYCASCRATSHCRVAGAWRIAGAFRNIAGALSRPGVLNPPPANPAGPCSGDSVSPKDDPNCTGGKQIVSNEINTSDDSFEDDVLKSDLPVLVDYWAEWCGPCKMIAPVLDEMAGEYDGKLKIVKLNIDENPKTPPKYGIRGIPTLMLFKNGSVEAQKVGAMSKSQLTAFIDTNL